MILHGTYRLFVKLRNCFLQKIYITPYSAKYNAWLDLARSLKQEFEIFSYAINLYLVRLIYEMGAYQQEYSFLCTFVTS